MHYIHTVRTYIFIYIYSRYSTFICLSIPKVQYLFIFFLLGMEWKYWDKIDGLGRTWLVYVEGFGSGFTMNTQVMKND